jgi:hypothetical protein
MRSSVDRLSGGWRLACNMGRQDRIGKALYRSRETAAMAATARWNLCGSARSSRESWHPSSPRLSDDRYGAVAQTRDARLGCLAGSRDAMIELISSERRTSLSEIDRRARRTRHCCSVMSKARSAGRKCRMTASYERSKATGSEGEIARERTRGVWGAICHPNVFGSPRRGTHAKPHHGQAAQGQRISLIPRAGGRRGARAGSLCLKSSPNLLAAGAIGLKRERRQWTHVKHVKYGVLAMGRSKGSSQSRSSSNAG